MLKLHATRKLFEKLTLTSEGALHVTPMSKWLYEKPNLDINPLSGWHGHLVTLQRRNCILMAHDSTRFPLVCSVNYLGRFSGNYPGRLIPIFNYRCSLPFCDGNFHLRNEGLSHDAPADRWRRWSSLSRRTVHPIARTTCLM